MESNHYYHYKIAYEGEVKYSSNKVIGYGDITIKLDGVEVLKVMDGTKQLNTMQLLDNEFKIIPYYWPRSYQIYVGDHFITNITCNPKYMPRCKIYSSYDVFNALIQMHNMMEVSLFKRLFYTIESIRIGKCKNDTYSHLMSCLQGGCGIKEWIDELEIGPATVTATGFGIIPLLINATRNSRLYDLANEVFYCMTGHQLTRNLLSCFENVHVAIEWQDLIDATSKYNTPILDYYIGEIEKLTKQAYQVPTTWLSGRDMFHKIYLTMDAYLIDMIQPKIPYRKRDAMEWHLKCNTTQRDFCTKYHIDPANFTYYLLFDHYYSPSSQSVISSFLSREVSKLRVR